MIVLPQDWEDKNVNTSLLDEQDGGTRLPHITTPPFYIWKEGKEGGTGGRRRAGSENKTKLNGYGTGQKWM